MTEDQIRTSLEEIGTALSQGDPQGVAEHWEVPGLVLADQGAIPIATLEEVRSFFASSIDDYRQRGLMSTRPTIEHVELMSDGLASVDVSWAAFDAAGQPQGAERSHYLMHLGRDGKARIQVALSRAA